MSHDEDTRSWYWGECSQEFVDNYIVDRPNGTFVVYQKTGSEDITLAYRVNGRTQREIIIHKDGLYGFAEPLGFETLESALDAYNWSPTETGNTLLFPGVKPGTVSVCLYRRSMNLNDRLSLLRRIKQNGKLLAEKDFELEQLARQRTLLDQKLSELNCLNESLNQLLLMLETQLKKHHEVTSCITSRYAENEISENFTRLTNRIRDINTDQKNKREEKSRVHEECVSVRGRYIDLSAELLSLKREIYKDKRMLVQSYPVCEVFIANLLQSVTRDSDIPTDVNDAIVPQKIDQSKAERRLLKEEDGAFMVRLNSTISDIPFILSVCQSGVVYHFPVYKVEGYFGLDKTMSVFDSIQELIEHYTKVPFEKQDRMMENLILNKQIIK